MTKLTVAFRNFANAPKKQKQSYKYLLLHVIFQLTKKNHSEKYVNMNFFLSEEQPLKFIEAFQIHPLCYVGTITASYSASVLLVISAVTGYPTFFVASFNENQLLPAG